MDGMHAPLFVTIDNPRRHSADVRAGANKQENDEKERLEVEQRGLQPELVAMKRLSSCQITKRKDRERTRTMGLFES